MKTVTLMLVSIIAGWLDSCLAGPMYINRASDQSFTHRYEGGWEYFVGGGVAAFDCNDDQYPDLYVAGGENAAKLLINQSDATGAPLKFERWFASSTDIESVTGAYPLDVDSDGILDLFLLRVGENRILKGLGDCRFEAANERWGFDGSDRWSTAFSATWEPGKTLPTLAIGNYVNRDDPDGPFETCDNNKLFRPDGSLYGPPRVLEPGYCALSMLISDWARKGQSDLRISNDRHYYVRQGEEQLLRLSKTPRFYTNEQGWESFKLWGMGIASRDISGDGLPEIYLTSMGDQKLMSLNGDSGSPNYHEASYHRGTTAHRPYIGGDGRPSSGWHAGFGDVDNDGLDDLFIAKGNVDQMPDAAMHDPNNLLMQQTDGRFVEAGDRAGLADVARSRGAAVIDLNLDGKLDIVVVNRRAHIGIYENMTTETGNWLAIELAQSHINRNAVGAWIELTDGVKTWSREITIGGGHAGGQAGYEHFGVGSLEQVSYRVIWPDGNVGEWKTVAVNQFVSVRRSASEN